MEFTIVKINNNKYVASTQNIEQNVSDRWDKYKEEGVIHNGLHTDAI